MTEVGLQYDRPREKLQKKGAAALTNAELLQVLIGSGNAQASVAHIARKTLRQLTKRGNDVAYDDLLMVSGLGPATAAQIIAAFELASRYPVSRRQLTIDTQDKARGLVQVIAQSKITQLTYVTLDGAKRLIAQRTVSISATAHPSSLLRQIFSHVVTDRAAGMFVAVGAADHSLDPSMFELSLARDLNAMAQLFIVTVHGLLIVSRSGERSLRSESW